MTHRILLALHALTLLACAGPAEALDTRTLSHGGRTRTYHVRTPTGWTAERRWPLVLALHGGGGKGSTFDAWTTAGALGREADRRGIVVVYPQGVERAWRDGRKDHLRGKTTGIDDVGFISALIDVLVQSTAVDPRRVYATGISNGGFMSYRLACDLPHKLAAVAPVTANLPLALQERTPAQPISLMVVNGTADPLVPYGGGEVRLLRFGRGRGRILSTDATLRWWAGRNGCPLTPSRTTLADADPADGTRVTRVTYSGGRGGSEVVLLKVTGGGHTWPGGTQYLPARLIGRTSRDIDATREILTFFARHSR